MILNETGNIVLEEIHRTEEIRENVTIDSWVVMPNHVHLILLIHSEDFVETPRRGVSTEEQQSWKSGCLGAIINQLKGACTRRIRSMINPDFAWQSRFYDHVIWTEQDLDDLRQYIQRNPENNLTHA